MMWDLSGGRARSQSPPRNRSSPMAMPSPAFAMPQASDSGFSAHSSYPGNSYPPNPDRAISGFLTIPQPHFPGIQTSHSDSHVPHRRHHHHSHHHHSHSHSHSHSPSPVVVSHTHHSSQSHIIRPSHSQTNLRPPAPHAQVHFVAPGPRPVHHSHSQTNLRPPPHAHAAAPDPRPYHPSYHPQFKYSRCTGRKRALCIGINYRGQPNELRGCINDARSVRDFLVRQCRYKASDIVMLTDDSPNPRSLPTRKNIIEAMYWLVKDAHPDDSLFFHYSGHGGQTKDLDGDEIDGKDEVIYPLDFKKRGHITDDEMHRIMVKPLPAGCRLTALFDCCHSGSVLDLPFIYDSKGRLKGSHVSQRALGRKSTPADAISWSGCKDGQTSADTFHGGVAVGAMSFAFISSLSANPNQSYQQLLKSVRSILYSKFSQKPQLGSSHHIDTNLQFII